MKYLVTLFVSLFFVGTLQARSFKIEKVPGKPDFRLIRYTEMTKGADGNNVEVFIKDEKKQVGLIELIQLLAVYDYQVKKWNDPEWVEKFRLEKIKKIKEEAAPMREVKEELEN